MREQIPAFLVEGSSVAGILCFRAFESVEVEACGLGVSSSLTSNSSLSSLSSLMRGSSAG